MGLASDLARFAAKTRADLDTAHREVVTQVINSIVTGSAVGNPDLWKHPVAGYTGGRFRANWVPGVNVVNTTTTENTDAGGEATIAALIAAIPKPGGVFYITNSLPYARRLEYEGWSKQMPAGVVRVTAMRFNEWLQKEIA